MRNPQEICDIIRNTLHTGNHVSILSFTYYPEIVSPTLFAIGLTEEEISKIFIKGYYPGDTGRSTQGNLFGAAEEWSKKVGKNEHIDAAKVHFGIQNDGQVILVDDNTLNIDFAKKKGCHTILVPIGFNCILTSLKPTEIRKYEYKSHMFLEEKNITEEVVACYFNGIKWCETSKLQSELNKLGIVLPQNGSITKSEDVSNIISFFGCTQCGMTNYINLIHEKISLLQDESCGVYKELSLGTNAKDENKASQSSSITYMYPHYLDEDSLTEEKTCALKETEMEKIRNTP